MEKDAAGFPQGLTNSGIRRYLASRLPYRELTRTNALGSLHRLDDLVATGGLSYPPVTTAAWRQAALLWADARQRGVPTASADALDADVILAACAAMIGQPGDPVIVATVNVGHLARYCDARLWTTIS